MIAVILVIHVFIAVALIGAVLLQRSEGGGLGMGGGTMGGLMTSRGSASLLTRITAGLATCFMATSIVLAIMSGSTQTRRSIMEQPTATAPAQPAPPPAPSVPMAR
jgi:preprotein translocase subunit SecG